MVTRGNLDDRLEVVRERIDGEERLIVERWTAHKESHRVVEQSLRDYKTSANEWRDALADRGTELIELHGSFMSKTEFQSEHRGLEAKLHGEIVALAGKLETLDGALDTVKGDVKDLHTESNARRSVFSDSRNVLATAGIVFGLIATGLLILDRITH
jgi:chromosome segregation ATPase